MEPIPVGRLANDSDVERDAVHIAIARVTATEFLLPGHRVGVKGGEAFLAIHDAVGVVDPFLREPVKKGQQFFVFLNPNTVTGMRHLWSHPVFDEEKAKKFQAYLEDDSIPVGGGAYDQRHDS